MTVGTICTRQAITIDRDSYVAAAAGVMRERGVGYLIVADAAHGGRKPVGVVTDRDMVIKVAMPEYWPLPWLLRDFPRTGFWFEQPDDWNADVLLVSPDLFESIPESQRAGLATEFFGLRDGVIVILTAERDLWQSSIPESK